MRQHCAKRHLSAFRTLTPWRTPALCGTVSYGVSPANQRAPEQWQSSTRGVTLPANDWHRIVTFYQLAEEQWRLIRATNVVESPGASVR
jgi:hypothetical protein